MRVKGKHKGRDEGRGIKVGVGHKRKMRKMRKGEGMVEKGGRKEEDGAVKVQEKR